ncbi:MAG TPA: hypothetical protein VEH27_15035 [Methylomirabilota bacterium]|nr:hypothetical protein [Methylomirabilota bacterium]
MNALLFTVGWCILLVLCWPLALALLVLAPVVWLISLPLRLIGFAIGGLLALVKSIFYLPARLLRGSPKRACTCC